MVMMFAVATGVMAQTQPCGTTTWTLWAGQTINVGTVTVSNDDTNLYVTYAIDTNNYPEATFGILHLWVGNDLNNLPMNDKGNPIPGKFPFHFFDEGLTEYTFVIPFEKINITDIKQACGTALYVVPHAEVNNVNGEDETAFGGCIGVNIEEPGRWWYYCTYTICCEEGPPSVCFTETAFAKGTHVWTTDKKSNPDNLPSLNLTKNRWGWAINLTNTGEYTYDIWAGAGLNKIYPANPKAVKVGTLTVDWDGSSATITYNMFAGYYLQEVHIYASDYKPTTLAPGQYGYPTEGYTVDNLSTFSYNVLSLSDTDNDGVWIIGHALVSSGQCD